MDGTLDDLQLPATGRAEIRFFPAKRLELEKKEAR
jgi:hypothetical protein